MQHYRNILTAATCLLTSCSLFGQPTAFSFFRRDIPVIPSYGYFELTVPNASVKLADLNGDGKPDLIFTGLNGFSVQLNLGGGRFGAPILNSRRVCGQLIPGDFDGDGKVDLFAEDRCTFPGGGGAVLAGRGDGTFGPAKTVLMSGLSAAGDVNGDGKLDLIVNVTEDTSLRALLGNGDGTFRPGATIGGGPSNGGQILIADFNHDGKPDVAAYDGFNLRVYLGKGDGSFGSPVVTFLGTLDRILAADVTGDGLPDILLGFSILQGNGDGSFQPARTYFQPNRRIDAPTPLAAADLDGDGKVDIVVGSGYRGAVDNRVWIFRGGSMSDPISIFVGWEPYVGAVADVDGDGRPDIVVGNLTSSTATLLLSGRGGDLSQTRAVSPSGGSTLLAPGSLASLYVPTGATTPEQAQSQALPTQLAGVALDIRDSSGAVFHAPLLYVSPTQINFVIPDAAATGEGSLAISNGAGSRQAGTLEIVATAPEILMVSYNGLAPAGFNLIVAPDGGQSLNPLFKCVGDSCEVAPAVLRDSGSYLVLYATGLGHATTNDVKCLINGLDFTVQYAGPQGAPGLQQINIRLPDSSTDFWDDIGENGKTLELVCSARSVLTNRFLMPFRR